MSLKRITFNDCEDARIEIYCDHCDRIEYGTEPEIYQCAESFVENLAFNFFPELPDNENRRVMNVAKICEIMAWGFKHTGFIDKSGFTVPCPAISNEMSECLVLRADEIEPEGDSMQ